MQKLKNLLSENDSEKFDDKLLEFSLNYVAKKVDIIKLVNDGDIRLGIDKYSPELSLYLVVRSCKCNCKFICNL